mgnify:CR=1 FL=1
MPQLHAILCALLLLAWSSVATAQPRSEKLEFDVTWGYSDVAKMTLVRGCPRNGYTPAALTARSRGAAEQLHAFEVRLDSFVASQLPLEGRTYIFEDGRPRSFRTRFGQKTGDTKVTKKFRKQETTLKLELEHPTHDLLSWIFVLRNRKLSNGASYDYYVWDGWKLARITATVGKPERVWTPAGTHDAYRIQIARRRLHHAGAKKYAPLRDTEHLATLWLSTSSAHIPVALDFDAPVGTAKVRLTRSSIATCSE